MEDEGVAQMSVPDSGTASTAVFDRLGVELFENSEVCEDPR